MNWIVNTRHRPHSTEPTELTRECGTGVQGEVETREGKRNKKSSRIPLRPTN